MTLTKRHLVIRIGGKSVLTQKQVSGVVQKTLDCISEALANGGRVELRDFGVFELKVRKAHFRRNPNKPQDRVFIPARLAVKFKPSKKMRREVFKLTPKTQPQF